MLLGGMEATCVGMLVTMFVVSLAPATRQPIFTSPTGRVVGAVMNNLGPVLPDEVRKVLAPHWDPNTSSLVADATVNNSPNNSGHAADSAAETATSSELPALHEATPSGDRSASNFHLPALPPLEAAPGNDSAVQPANSSSLEGLVKKGRHKVEQAVADSIDKELGRLEDLVPAPQAGPK
jgi:membrane protein required for colicin V production